MNYLLSLKIEREKMKPKQLFSVIVLVILLASGLSAEGESIKNQRLDIIRYGIDTEIMDLVKTLKKDKNSEFNPEFLKLLKTIHNTTLESKIIDLFRLKRILLQ